MNLLISKTLALSVLLLSYITSTKVLAQPIPAKENNFDLLQTFGNKAPLTWGDDDYVQTFFVSIPLNYKEPFYIRIFDADCGGENDQANGAFNTKTKFSIYGAKGAYSNPDARKTSPIGNYKSGLLLNSKTFALDAKYDNKWFTFGPFNPSEGEYDTDLKSMIFKLIAEGIDGDDGNLYSYYISTKPTENISLEGVNSFAYELSFRMPPNPKRFVHVYPFIDKAVTSILQNNFDFDNVGSMKLTSISKKNINQLLSNDGNWVQTKSIVSEAEKNNSMDYAFNNDKNFVNDVVIFFVNQYGQAIPFFTTPIGGLPKYRYKIDINYEVGK